MVLVNLNQSTIVAGAMIGGLGTAWWSTCSPTGAAFRVFG